MQITRPRHSVITLIVSVCFIAGVAHAAPPAGQSALLNGMHDPAAIPWLLKATVGCDKGWLTDLQYLSEGPINCNKAATDGGISIIQRLDPNRDLSFTTNPSDADAYAQRFADAVTKCSNIHVWIVGNEPNLSFKKSDPDCTANNYADGFVKVYNRIKSIPGHQNDLVLAAANSPFSPGCMQSMRMIIRRIKSFGVTPDGMAIHAYTQHGSGNTLSPGAITNASTQGDGTIDECGGTATWNDTWHQHFFIYKDYINLIEQEGMTGKAVFITEAGNACFNGPAGSCYPNTDVGYFQAMYNEINEYNKTAKTKIRAITPYRWSEYSEPSGHSLAISNKPALQEDLKKAFAKKYKWTTSKCTSGTTPQPTEPTDPKPTIPSDPGPSIPGDDDPQQNNNDDPSDDPNQSSADPNTSYTAGGCACQIDNDVTAAQLSDGSSLSLVILAGMIAWSRRRRN